MRTRAGDRLKSLYVVAVATGLRQGELFALRWEDVDLDTGTLWVRHTLSSTEGGRPIFATPTPSCASPKTRKNPPH